MAEAQPLFMLLLPGNCSWVWGAAWKTGVFFAASVLTKAPDILLTLTVLVPPVLLIQGQKQEDPHHSTTSKITLPASHQTLAYVAFKWWEGWEPQPCLCTLKLCRAEEEMAAWATAGAQLTGYNYGFPQQQHNSAWDGTLSSLNTTSMQWGQFKMTRELWKIFFEG